MRKPAPVTDAARSCALGCAIIVAAITAYFVVMTVAYLIGEQQ